jgi:signal transduction histidine kinase
VRSILRHLSLRASRPASGWLTLLLLLAVLVPSVCLLWFMNQAMRNERLAMRQQLRDNLAQARDRLEAYWPGATRSLDTNLPAPALFAAAIRAGVADSVVCFDASGKVVYPDAGLPREREADTPVAESKDPVAAARYFASLAEHATNDTLAARALQGQVRCLMEAGNKEEALAVVSTSLAAPRFAQTSDAQGRWIVPSAELLALEAGGPSRPMLERLRGQLLDYNNAMPARQRRFLMRRLQKLFPQEPGFPTLAAEELAAAHLAAGPAGPGGEMLRAAALPGVWQIASSDRRLTLLFETGGLQKRLAPVLGTNVVLIPPGRSAGNYAMAAGAAQPGWQIAPSLRDRSVLDAASDAQIVSYLWVGVIAMAAVAALALLAVRLIRRQTAVAQLRNDLLANVTHELKTPLASMRLLVDTLLHSPVLDEPTARQYLQLIARENLRLSRLIDNFLAFSRMERNKQAFEFSEAAPKDIIEAAAAAVRERFNSPDCRFEAEVAPDLPRVTADAGALVTALLNLLDNAYKYSGDRKEILLRAGAENGHVTFAVRDNGIGVPPRETRRIFRRFYQVDQRLARTGGGCGLGLSIVQFIVAAHHGSVRVESEPGRGSTFIISLPPARAAAADEPAA